MSLRSSYAIAVSALLLSACNIVGPASLKSGRMVYNEAIVATNNEQTLAMIVGDRYAEPVGMLEMGQYPILGFRERPGADPMRARTLDALERLIP